MESLEPFKIRAHCLRFDFPQNQLDLIKAPGIRKKSAREPYAVAAPKGDMPKIAVDIIMGERASEMQRNSIRTIEDGRGLAIEALVRKPG